MHIFYTEALLFPHSFQIQGFSTPPKSAKTEVAGPKVLSSAW